MIRLEKIGEIETEVVGDITTADTLNVLLRIGWGAETTTSMTINPAEDLHAGDGVRVIIEKIIEEPDPEPEPQPEAEAATAEATAAAETEAKTEAAEAAAPEAPAAAEDKKGDAAGA
jgi:hypothetical protein